MRLRGKVFGSTPAPDIESVSSEGTDDREDDVTDADDDDTAPPTAPARERPGGPARALRAPIPDANGPDEDTVAAAAVAAVAAVADAGVRGRDRCAKEDRCTVSKCSNSTA